jgi:hypothetical protein
VEEEILLARRVARQKGIRVVRRKTGRLSFYWRGGRIVSVHLGRGDLSREDILEVIEYLKGESE